MRNLSSVLIQATPKRRERSDEPRSLDAILRSFVEDGPRWRSRDRRDGVARNRPSVESDPREAHAPR